MSPLRQDDGQLTRTVLLVEDHFLTRWSAAEYFRKVGFKVVEAVNASEAVGVMTCGAAAEVNIVFSDIIMPGGDDGYALAHWLAVHHPRLPVVLTSSAPRATDAPEDSPLRRFVPKPYDLSSLEQLFKTMLP